MIPDAEANFFGNGEILYSGHSTNSCAGGLQKNLEVDDENKSASPNSTNDDSDDCSLLPIESVRCEETEKETDSSDESLAPLIVDLTENSDEQGVNSAAVLAILAKSGNVVQKLYSEVKERDDCVVGSASDSNGRSAESFYDSASEIRRVALIGSEVRRNFAPYSKESPGEDDGKPLMVSRCTQVYEWELPPVKKRKRVPDNPASVLLNRIIDRDRASASAFSRVSTLQLSRHSYFNDLKRTTGRGIGFSPDNYVESPILPRRGFFPFGVPSRARNNGGVKQPAAAKPAEPKYTDPIQAVLLSLKEQPSTSANVPQSSSPNPIVCRHERATAESIVQPECARHKPFNGMRKARNWFSFISHPNRADTSSGRRQNGAGDQKQARGCRPKQMKQVSQAKQYKRLRQNPVAIRLGRSKIHGVGVFAEEDISVGQFIVEYKGEVIRNGLVERRENFYRGKGFGNYMFKIDLSFTVDGTLKGGMARFINHSCDPNCAAKVNKCEDNNKHIILLASKNIVKGEELSYDYKMPKERDKIPCLCGSANCRKYLN